MNQTAKGFTLVELMIVLLIMAILIAIALPSYNVYVQRAHRGHAKAALLKAAQWMERVATAQGRYPTTLAAGLEAVEGRRYTVCLVGGVLAAGVTLSSPYPDCVPTNAMETLTGSLPLDAASSTGFALVAYRNIPGGNAKDDCGDFTLTSIGVRGLINNSNTASTVLTDCWDK